MINSTPAPDRSERTDIFPSTVVKSPATRLRADQFSPQNIVILRAALAAQPEIRPEVVARGRALVADPSYPSAQVLRHVGAVILRAPDYTVDES